MSGLGKGLLSASIGRLLKACGYTVALTKIDPYLNFDAGTMSPFEHGEVFVLRDGGEVDLDFGHYERFVDIDAKRSHNITTGIVFDKVIRNERKGNYLGKTIQLIPHVTDEIKRRIRDNSKGADISIIELGGTVGDIEGLVFLEAIRQLRGEGALINIHLTFLPVQGIDQKTKPTQHSFIEMRRAGLMPDIMVGRCKDKLRDSTKRKISMFCSVKPEEVISDHNLDNVYTLPLLLYEEQIHKIIQTKLKLDVREPDLGGWKQFTTMYGKGPKVKVGIVGKYARGDTYLSIQEALAHAGVESGVNPELIWIDSEVVEKNPSTLSEIDCMITPGGFGTRGCEGKIAAIRYVRENKIPWLGLCLGFQLAVVEFARNVVGLRGANSTEMSEETKDSVIIPHWEAGHNIMGGTMRLGDKKVVFRQGTEIQKIYGEDTVYERHRHRYGLNPRYVDKLTDAGLVFSSVCPEDGTVETLEIPDQYFIGVQFHPEFQSRPNAPHPLFVNMLEAVKNIGLNSIKDR